MTEKDTVITEKMVFGGICDFGGFYNHAYDWLLDEGFDITEEKYSEKVKGEAKDLEIKWDASKKITDYFKVTLKLGWRVGGLVDVEVEVDGKKKSMNKLKVLEIKTKGILEKDYDSKWEGSSTQKFFREIYQKYVIPQRTEQKEGEVVKYVQDFNTEMKAYFELLGRR